MKELRDKLVVSTLPAEKALITDALAKYEVELEDMRNPKAAQKQLGGIPGPLAAIIQSLQEEIKALKAGMVKPASGPTA